MKRFDGGFVRFSDNAKGEVVGVGTITISPSCDFIEVYLVDILNKRLGWDAFGLHIRRVMTRSWVRVMKEKKP